MTPSQESRDTGPQGAGDMYPYPQRPERACIQIYNSNLMLYFVFVKKMQNLCHILRKNCKKRSTIYLMHTLRLNHSSSINFSASYITPCRKADPNLNECALQNAKHAVPHILKGMYNIFFPYLMPKPPAFQFEIKF